MIISTPIADYVTIIGTPCRFCLDYLGHPATKDSSIGTPCRFSQIIVAPLVLIKYMCTSPRRKLSGFIQEIKNIFFLLSISSMRGVMIKNMSDLILTCPVRDV